MFWMAYLIVLAKKLYRMMMFETMMLATDRDSGSIFYQYSEGSDDESDSMNPEEELCTVLSFYFLIIVLYKNT